MRKGEDIDELLMKGIEEGGEFPAVTIVCKSEQHDFPSRRFSDADSLRTWIDHSGK